MNNWAKVFNLFFCSLFFIGASVGAQTSNFDSSQSFVSYYAIDLATDEVLAERNSDRLMTPASLLKLVTTATALELKGTNYSSLTIFYSQGEIVDGQLRGDIIVKAAADGTLGSAHFASTQPDELIRLIKIKLSELGISSLNGRIVLDLSMLPPPYQPAGRLIEDVSNYYAATPKPLSWRDNTFTVSLKSPSLQGQICSIVDVVPPLDNIELRCYVESAYNNKDSAYIFGYPSSNFWDIRGSIPSGKDKFTIKGALSHPERLFGVELAACFDEKSQIQVKYCYRPPSYQLAKKLFAIQSPALSEVVKVINQRSNNLLADHLFLGLNNSDINPANRWTNAAQTTKEFWQSKGVFNTSLIYDGSGLSPRNKVTAHFLVDILKYMNTSPNASDFKNSLAVGGVSGTLRNLWKQPQYRGRVKAKSGTMEGVVNYAGYIQTRNNRKVAFSVMINHYSGSPEDPKAYLVSLISNWIDLN